MNVFVTGMGIISALGPDTASNWTQFTQQKSGLKPITHVPTRLKETFVAGEVSLTDEALWDHLPDGRPTRTAALAYWAAQEALNQARITPQELPRMGLISSSTVGGAVRTERYYQQFMAGEKTPDFIHTHKESESTEYLSRTFGIHRYILTLNTACSSSANAIVLGARLIRQGLLDRVLVGGADALCRFTLNGFHSLLLLDPNPCKPFDRNRQGINLGEGAGYLVLESEKSMRERGIEPIAQLSGYGSTNDAYHATSTSPEGVGLQSAMKRALTQARIRTTDIAYINAHGTGTANNDLTEGNAMKGVFTQVPAFSSIKSFTGHTLGAAGSIGAVVSIQALLTGQLPSNLNFSESIPEHQLIPLTQPQSRPDVRHVMTNAMGMGGSCCSLVFSKA